jgi:ParE toxin of type II toxin-antitoxin system, parDE
VRVVTSPIARDQMITAIQWWREHRPAAPRAIHSALQNALELLRFSPKLGTPVLGARLSGVRRAYLEKIDYHLYYRFDERRQVIYLLLFWHARRQTPPL